MEVKGRVRRRVYIDNDKANVHDFENVVCLYCMSCLVLGVVLLGEHGEYDSLVELLLNERTNALRFSPFGEFVGTETNGELRETFSRQRSNQATRNRFNSVSI